MNLREHINSIYTISEAYYNCFGENPPQGKVFCPFHPNKETPAAKVYDKSLYCFVCKRPFTAYDLLKKFREDLIEKEKGKIYASSPPRKRLKFDPIKGRSELDLSLPIGELLKIILP